MRFFFVDWRRRLSLHLVILDDASESRLKGELLGFVISSLPLQQNGKDVMSNLHTSLLLHSKKNHGKTTYKSINVLGTPRRVSAPSRRMSWMCRKREKKLTQKGSGLLSKFVVPSFDLLDISTLLRNHVHICQSSKDNWDAPKTTCPNGAATVSYIRLNLHWSPPRLWIGIRCRLRHG